MPAPDMCLRRRLRLLTLLLAASCATPPDVVLDDLTARLADDALPPTTAELPALLDRLTDLLGDPDPEVRDDLGYALLARWIVRDGAVPDAELRRLLERLRAGLHEPGDGDRAVLRRSFSMLCLSLLARRELDQPWLGQPEFDALLADGVDYLGRERDLRGYDPALGWVHAVAHTADLFKFLGRSPKLSRAQQALLVTAIADRVRTAATTFAAGEDLRLAQALLSLAARDDFDAAGFEQALATLRAPEAAAQAARIAAQENRRHVLLTLFALLQLDGRDRPGFAPAGRAVRAALTG